MIPALDSPYGPKAWDQPDRRAFLVDDHHAVMTRATFTELAEYSGTIPSGVYPGKLWKRHDGVYSNRYPSGNINGQPQRPLAWLLCWYAAHPTKPGYCDVHFREILLV